MRPLWINNQKKVNPAGPPTLKAGGPAGPGNGGDVFETRVGEDTPPDRLAGSLAKALLDGKSVRVEVLLEGDRGTRLLEALKLADKMARVNGTPFMLEVFEPPDRRSACVLLRRVAG